ncbi:hypothetical protein PR048_016257 [Dryococelus australis]|uniref:Uncharacterized protein n=1 Tax=Dryococelus australis TaxID=614101 RepID=A0ABQ9HJ82_9NEOP|nr:hypothetical protein PR048_016257 [Dryococelus australis]
MWESCRTMPLVGGFSSESPVSPALSFRRCSILTSITLVKSPLNILTHSLMSVANLKINLIPLLERPSEFQVVHGDYSPHKNLLQLLHSPSTVLFAPINMTSGIDASDQYLSDCSITMKLQRYYLSTRRVLSLSSLFELRTLREPRGHIRLVSRFYDTSAISETSCVPSARKKCTASWAQTVCPPKAASRKTYRPHLKPGIVTISSRRRLIIVAASSHRRPGIVTTISRRTPSIVATSSCRRPGIIATSSRRLGFATTSSRRRPDTVGKPLVHFCIGPIPEYDIGPVSAGRNLMHDAALRITYFGCLSGMHPPILLRWVPKVHPAWLRLSCDRRVVVQPCTTRVRWAREVDIFSFSLNLTSGSAPSQAQSLIVRSTSVTNINKSDKDAGLRSIPPTAGIGTAAAIMSRVDPGDACTMILFRKCREKFNFTVVPRNNTASEQYKGAHAYEGGVDKEVEGSRKVRPPKHTGTRPSQLNLRKSARSILASTVHSARRNAHCAAQSTYCAMKCNASLMETFSRSTRALIPTPPLHLRVDGHRRGPRALLAEFSATTRFCVVEKFKTDCIYRKMDVHRKTQNRPYGRGRKRFRKTTLVQMGTKTMASRTRVECVDTVRPYSVCAVAQRCHRIHHRNHPNTPLHCTYVILRQRVFCIRTSKLWLRSSWILLIVKLKDGYRARWRSGNSLDSHIREDPGSIPGPAILISAFHDFPKSLQANAGMGP